MKALITTDLHLTDKQEDEYRWEIFDVLIRRLKKEKSMVWVFILGDLTDRKDNHSSKLVNRVIKNLISLSSFCHKVKIVKGNHDYIDVSNPFFLFVNHFNGIDFVSDEQVIKIAGKRCLLKGHSFDFKNEKRFKEYDYLFIHQTVNKAAASNGYEMEGISSRFGTSVFSGDIHVPQKVGDVVYVGSPYPVHLGDSFQPRYAILDFETGKIRYRKIKTIRKETIDYYPEEDGTRSYKEYGLKAGDFVKVRVYLHRSNADQWSVIRQKIASYFRKKGVRLKGIDLVTDKAVKQLKKNKRFGVTSNKRSVFERHCKDNQLSEVEIVQGQNILKGVK